MKKQHENTMKNSIRRIAINATLVIALVVNAVPTSLKAQDNPKPSAAVKYLGNTEDQLLFQIDLENKESENVIIIIKDDEGNTLFNGKFREKTLTKKFQFDRNELGTARL